MDELSFEDFKEWLSKKDSGFRLLPFQEKLAKGYIDLWRLSHSGGELSGKTTVFNLAKEYVRLFDPLKLESDI